MFAPAGAFVGRWLQSFLEYPPRQKPDRFNLDRVMEAVTKAHKWRPTDCATERAS